MSRTDKFALGLIDELKSHCDEGIERIKAFTRWSRQVEGWFKGELLMIAAEMVDQGKVREFRPDYRIDTTAGKQNIDLYFVPDFGTPIWIELKHWYLGKYQGGANWSATTYCTQSTSGTPNNFIKRLSPTWSQSTYMLIAMTPSPQPNDWSGALSRLRKRHSGWIIRTLTKLEKSRPEYYLGLLKVQSSGRR